MKGGVVGIWFYKGLHKWLHPRHLYAIILTIISSKLQTLILGGGNKRMAQGWLKPFDLLIKDHNKAINYLII